MDMIRWFIGQDSPRAVTAIGGKYAGIKDNREIPDTLQVLWEFDGTLVSFEQFNANAAPGNGPTPKWSCAARRARCTFSRQRPGRWCPTA